MRFRPFHDESSSLKDVVHKLLSLKQASRHVTPNLHHDWVLLVLVRRSKHFQKWKSFGLVPYPTREGLTFKWGY